MILECSYRHSDGARCAGPFGHDDALAHSTDPGLWVEEWKRLRAEEDFVRIHRDDLLRDQNELKHLREQVRELQQRGTELKCELRVIQGNQRAALEWDRQRMVRDFMTVITPRHPRPAVPTIPDEALLRMRLKLVGEEFCELVMATFASSGTEPWRLKSLREDITWVIERCPIKIDLPELADATVDLDYVVEGLRITFGLDSRPLWAEVHRANMTKAGGPIREDGKQLKPPGWTPPDIAGCIEQMRAPQPGLRLDGDE